MRCPQRAAVHCPLPCPPATQVGEAWRNQKQLLHLPRLSLVSSPQGKEQVPSRCPADAPVDAQQMPSRCPSGCPVVGALLTLHVVHDVPHVKHDLDVFEKPGRRPAGVHVILPGVPHTEQLAWGGGTLDARKYGSMHRARRMHNMARKQAVLGLTPRSLLTTSRSTLA